MKKKDSSIKTYLKDDDIVHITDKFIFTGNMLMKGEEVLGSGDDGVSTVKDMRRKMNKGNFQLLKVYRLYK